MALGEAFVNVRADLKPFSKDLEKGLKAILLAAEKRIAAEGKVGNALKEELKKKSGEGVEEGMRQGSKKGRTAATKEFESFFASFADFLDDGLSAIPAKVKAGLIVGLIAAGIIASPLIAGLITAAILGGVSVAAASIGTILAFRLNSVQRRFQILGQGLLNALMLPAQRFVEPLLAAADEIDHRFGKLQGSIDQIFAAGADAIQPLVDALLSMIENIIPGLIDGLHGAMPIISALAAALPKLGRDIGSFFSIISEGGPESAIALRDFLAAVGDLIIKLAILINFLADLYYHLRLVGAYMSGDWAQAAQLQAERALGAAEASQEFGDTLSYSLNPALSATAAEARATALAIAPLITDMLKGQEAAIDFEQGMDDLAKSIKDGNKDFDIRNQKGRDNLRIVDSIITAAAKQRDEDIKTAIQNGQSTDQIEADYQRKIDAAEKMISKTGHETQALQDLFDKAREAPKEVAIPVSAPGLGTVIGLFGTLKKRVQEVAQGLFNDIKANAAKKGKNNTSPTPSHQFGSYADGGIIDRPTFGLMGEAGYDEAVIPDPAVMPARAMQLSDQLGLTSMIAESLGARQQIVNVYIGSQRLQEMMDYTVAMNNSRTARGFAQGTRK